ncbi:DsbA family protein [Nocardioides sp. GXQ0305]|uniref:DsbA family protein n=1 Tax=Nocardioides sp. GXQ0305 TaxID=3423912 RepID=UPI003D7E1E20
MSKKAAAQSRAERAAAVVNEQRRRERRRRTGIIAAVVVAVVAVLVVALVLGNRSDTSGEAADQTPSGVDDYTVTVGEADAPTVITVYEDPQCPICAAFEGQVGEPVAQAVEAGDVRVDYRIVSFLDQASENEYSSRAANALYAVQDVAGAEAFAEMHRILFENQPAEGSAGPEDDQLVEWAVEAGADEAEVRPLIEDRVFEQFVVNATDQMSKNGVTGTPTVLIDGEKVGENPQEAAQAVLDAVG